MARPLRIFTIIGARPQIIKAAALSRAIAAHFSDRIEEIILHTGQHYDAAMSQVFFDELNIPRPHIQLDAGSASHGVQTARMLEGIEKSLIDEKPDVVVIYGDTNSTLAAAIAASKLHIPIAHIEAGLRSFNKSMPEEINRITSDHCSTWLFCPTSTAVRNLEREGFSSSRQGRASIDHPHVVLSGDVMYDNSLHFATLASERSHVLADLGLKENSFALATIHRPANTDEPVRLASILRSLLAVITDKDLHVVLPLHPRTRERFDRIQDKELLNAIASTDRFRVIAPVGFLDMTALEQNAWIVLTDSGG
ncbi:MAG: UDP-N-acetylglucosamine 2-epimerase (non-hydrolyzing), partial [Bacteroidota bacterium]|nr:UDP-N-acetylglucosamine 2-epimerase (non-hydrolyzing) [Bacteroidota bacterium]